MARTLSTEARAFIAEWKAKYPDESDATARAAWDREAARRRQAKVRARARAPPPTAAGAPKNTG